MTRSYFDLESDPPSVKIEADVSKRFSSSNKFLSFWKFPLESAKTKQRQRQRQQKRRKLMVHDEAKTARQGRKVAERTKIKTSSKM